MTASIRTLMNNVLVHELNKVLNGVNCVRKTKSIS